MDGSQKSACAIPMLRSNENQVDRLSRDISSLEVKLNDLKSLKEKLEKNKDVLDILDLLKRVGY